MKPKTTTKKDVAMMLNHRMRGIDQPMAEEAVNHVVDILNEQMILGNIVVFRKFGALKPLLTKPKIGRNIRENTPIDIPAKYVAKFYASKELLYNMNVLEIPM